MPSDGRVLESSLVDLDRATQTEKRRANTAAIFVGSNRVGAQAQAS
jgi:hypothetical protein